MKIIPIKLIEWLIFSSYVYTVRPVKQPKKTALPGGCTETTDMKKANIPTDPEHSWEWVKYQLRPKGSSLAKLARELKVSGSAIKNTKIGPYPRMERAIAKKLGMAPADIWPERWHTNGAPVRQCPNRAEIRVPYYCTENESSNLAVKPHRKPVLEA